MKLWLPPAGLDCSVIRSGLVPWFGRISVGFLVLDGCFVALSVPASVSTTEFAPVTIVDENVVASDFVLSSSSELQ